MTSDSKSLANRLVIWYGISHRGRYIVSRSRAILKSCIMTTRWNLLLRTKNHRRFMPFLLPPPDFTAKELDALQLTGTCETQICRSAGPWSIGTSNKIEHSIQTAYIKAIQMSDHFVYIENQFFITSTTVVGTTVENNIGNALVARIQQAHAEGTPWRSEILSILGTKTIIN